MLCFVVRATVCHRRRGCHATCCRRVLEDRILQDPRHRILDLTGTTLAVLLYPDHSSRPCLYLDHSRDPVSGISLVLNLRYQLCVPRSLSLMAEVTRHFKGQQECGCGRAPTYGLVEWV